MVIATGTFRSRSQGARTLITMISVSQSDGEVRSARPIPVGSALSTAVETVSPANSTSAPQPPKR